MKFITLLLTVLIFHFDMQAKTVVLILGTGRSGTSCLSGVLDILGLPMAHEGGKPKINPKGIFEHKETTRLNIKLIQQITGKSFVRTNYIDWDAISPHQKATYMQTVQTHIQKHFATKTFFGLKNPQIAPLLPLYLTAFQNLNFDIKIIVATRKPEAVAQSMSKITGINLLEGYHFVTCYLTPLVEYLNDHIYHVVKFNTLLKDPASEAARLQQFIPQLSSYEDKKDAINAWIAKDLQHFKRKYALD